MELKVFESPGQEWDEFASRYTDLIFYQSVWSEVLKKGLGGQPLYFCLKEGGEIVAGLPGVLLRLKIFKILYASIPYGNFIGNKLYFLPFMESLNMEFRKRRIDQVRLTESPFSESYSPESFKRIPAKCSLLDLRRFEKNNILECYRSEVRRAIRKAQKQELFVRRATTRKEVEIFYRLYLSSMERNRAMAKYPPRWFDALYDLLVQQRKADFLLAVKDADRYAAGVVLIHSKTSDHYLHNGSAETYLESRPNDLIVDHIIRKGVEEGKTTLDFMGSEPGDLSLLRFKEKWGSQSLDLYTYVKDFRPLRCKIWELGKRAMNSSLGSWVLRRIRV
jgi:lipid II:glycine glycyltransferase (peptidoglycan interpeptide bridge formation enzyme)